MGRCISSQSHKKHALFSILFKHQPKNVVCDMRKFGHSHIILKFIDTFLCIAHTFFE